MVYISVISPIRNEEHVLLELMDSVRLVMEGHHFNDWEFILVNDASTDNSKKIIEGYAKKNKHIVLLNHDTGKGQTGCFKSAFDAAKGDIVVTIDGDLQMPPETIPEFIKKIQEGYDVVNAIRGGREHPFWIKVASRLYNLLMLLMLNSPVLDGSSNYTAFKTKYVKNLPLQGNDHRYIIPIAMRRGARKIGEVLVDHRERKHGSSKYKALPKYIKGFPEIFIAWIRIKIGVYDLKH